MCDLYIFSTCFSHNKIIKGYAAQEKDIYTSLADARAKLAGAQTVSDKANADNQLSGALSRLLVIVENYPELKSDQNFRDLSVSFRRNRKQN